MINRKVILTQAIENGFDQTSEGYPDILKYCKEKNAYDYTIYGNCGKNLLPYPFENTTKTINGITFTDNGDGTVTANGTATATAQFFPKTSGTGPLLAPGTYTFSGCPNGGDWKTYNIRLTGFTANRDFGNGSTFTLTQATRVGMSLTIVTGATVENLVFKPQIESGSTKTDYEPYKKVGDLDAESGKYILPVTVSGKNLLNSYGYSAQGIPAPSSERANTNNYGTTISTIEPNTTLTVTQTKTDNPDNPASYYNGYFCIGINSNLIGKKIKFVCDINITNNPLNVNHFLTLPNSVNVNGVITLENGRAVGIFDIPKNDTRQYIEIRNAGCSLIISNIMITEADETNTDYEPYTAPKTTNLLLDAPLGPNESVNYKADNLPALPLFNNTSIIMTKTEVPPSNISVTYNTKVKGD